MTVKRKPEGVYIRGICVTCEKNQQAGRGLCRKGLRRMWRAECSSCINKRQGYGQYKNRKHKKDSCEECGFVAKHPCQLDVDHIDGNHKNDDVSNLQTLCANCHRLKTYINKDWTSTSK